MNYPVVVPTERVEGARMRGAVDQIDRASGIVIAEGPRGGGLVTLYYEGNRYNARNIRTFGDRVYHAADRAQQHYPTIAVCVTSASHVVRVGYFDGERVIEDDAFGHARLVEWLGADFDESELRRSRG